MNKQENRDWKFSYCEIKDEDVTNVLSIDLTPGEVRALQVLFEYLMPTMLGWHCIENPSVVRS